MQGIVLLLVIALVYGVPIGLVVAWGLSLRSHVIGIETTLARMDARQAAATPAAASPAAPDSPARIDIEPFVD